MSLFAVSPKVLYAALCVLDHLELPPASAPALAPAAAETPGKKKNRAAAVVVKTDDTALTGGSLSQAATSLRVLLDQLLQRISGGSAPSSTSSARLPFATWHTAEVALLAGRVLYSLTLLHQQVQIVFALQLSVHVFPSFDILI
jgi:hypothetical protein